MTHDTSPNDIRQVWSKVQANLAETVSTHNFESFFSKLELADLDDGHAVVAAGDEFLKNWVEDNYLDVLEDAFEDVMGDVSVELVVEHHPKQATLPIVRPEERVVPNSVARSALFGIVRRGRRKDMKKALIASWKNSSIVYTGEELDQGDLDVWMQALRLMHDEELGSEVHFAARGFLKQLGRHAGKSDYDWLDRALTRLKANAVEVRLDKFTYVGSLIHEYYKDDDTGRFVLVLNPKLVGLFEFGMTRVQFEERLSLRRQVSKWLHSYIQSHRATPGRPHRIGIEKLRDLCRSSTKHLWKFRQQLRDSMEEMEELGVVDSWRITKGDALEFIRPSVSLPS
jgi:hypothetical protein